MDAARSASLAVRRRGCHALSAIAGVRRCRCGACSCGRCHGIGIFRAGFDVAIGARAAPGRRWPDSPGRRLRIIGGLAGPARRGRGRWRCRPRRRAPCRSRADDGATEPPTAPPIRPPAIAPAPAPITVPPASAEPRRSPPARAPRGADNSQVRNFHFGSNSTGEHVACFIPFPALIGRKSVKRRKSEHGAIRRTDFPAKPAPRHMPPTVPRRWRGRARARFVSSSRRPRARLARPARVPARRRR